MSAQFTGTVAAGAVPEQAVPGRRRMAQFVELNGISPYCAKLLSRMEPIQVEWIMDQEFFVKGDLSDTASDKVSAAMALCKKKSRDFWVSYPTKSDITLRLESYLKINQLDSRCAATLERLPEALLRQVMDTEFVVQVDHARGTASAKVIGHVLHIKSN